MICAYLARTTHRRFKPRPHAFAYSVFYLCLDIDRAEEDLARARLISHNKFNLFSFFDADHGDRSGAPLRSWAQDAFAGVGVNLGGGRIMLLALPRVLGFVFNPLSIFFGFGPDGALRGVLYEVRNTFGESHTYAAPAAATGMQRQHAAKVFHVSPFFDVHGEYRFAIREPTDTFALKIENRLGGELEHVATLDGARRELTDAALIAAFFRLPLMTFGVVAAIHWQAFQLWLKGARYRRKPPPPAVSVSMASSAGGPR